MPKIADYVTRFVHPLNTALFILYSQTRHLLLSATGNQFGFVLGIGLDVFERQLQFQPPKRQSDFDAIWASWKMEQLVAL